MQLVLFSCSLIAFLNRVRGQLLILPLLSDKSDELDASPECTCEYVDEWYDPTCGSNGYTYINPMSLYCDQKCKDPLLSVAYKGACKEVEAPPKQNFTEEFDQASDVSKTRIMNKCSCEKTHDYNPICGTNGHTYHNYAELQCERKCHKRKIGIKYYGLCREDRYFEDALPFLSDALARCGCGYTDESDPVCGTDGYTYPNPSMLLCVTRCNNPSLQIVHYGTCVKSQKPHNFGAVRCDCRSTSKLYRPLCATNGVTYDNPALFYCAQECLNSQLTVVAEQPCREKENIDERGA